MRKQIKIGNKTIREENPVFIIAEIGLNHNGDINLAKKLINVAVKAGCDAVKFQKRDPELCVPLDQRDKKRDTPWGHITYMDYRYKVEFSEEQYEIINEYCKRKGILWSASCWDVNSFKFISSFDVPFHKVASAMLTNKPLLDLLAKDGKPIISSTGMSTLDEIDTAIKILESGGNDVALLHCTSTYPCPLNEINLRMIPTLRERYSVPVGYSGHETGLVPTWAAVALGSTIVERHITLDRSMWGSDQAASVEPGGLMRMVKGIREIEASIGNGQKRVYEREKPIRDKLRF